MDKSFEKIRPQLTLLRVLALLLSLSALFLCFIYFKTEPKSMRIARQCYFHNARNPNATGKAITYFEDLLTSVKQPEYDQGIFFVESKCLEDAVADIKPRYACSIESAAKANPTREVFLVFASPVGLPRYEQNWSTTIKTLMEYPNIHFRNVQLQQLCANTPLEDEIATMKLFKSMAIMEHASDIIRTLIVYRYGGTYLDQDYMMIQRLDTIERNWIAFQTEHCLNGAIFDFRRNGIGHIVMDAALGELAENYRPDVWAWNGPDLFARVMKKICQVEYIGEVLDKNCRGVQLYPPNRFYPLWGPESLNFFNSTLTKTVLNQSADMMGFHFWNSESRKIEGITMGNGAAYDLIAKEYCPQIYNENPVF